MLIKSLKVEMMKVKITLIRIESPTTHRGIPDAMYKTECSFGFIEFKVNTKMNPAQILFMKQWGPVIKKCWCLRKVTTGAKRYELYIWSDLQTPFKVWLGKINFQELKEILC